MDNEIFLQAMTQRHSQVCIAPTTVNSTVRKLLTKLELETEPVELKVKNEQYSKAASCYYNVAEKVKRDYGKIHFGWAIWQSPYLCEAEHHAVWEDSTGNLLDITPRVPHHSSIMFLPDNDVPYEGKCIPNIRVNATDNPLVDDMILAFDVLDWTRRYETRSSVDAFRRPPIVTKYVGDATNPGPLNQIAHNLEIFYLLGNEIDSNCYCNSSKPYSNCHAKINESHLTIYVRNIIATCGYPE